MKTLRAGRQGGGGGRRGDLGWNPASNRASWAAEDRAEENGLDRGLRASQSGDNTRPGPQADAARPPGLGWGDPQDSRGR